MSANLPNGGDRKSDEYKENNQRYNVTLKRGNSQEYLLRWLAREHPESLGEIGEGKKFKSPRQAAIHFGKVKQKITMQFDPEESGGQIVSKLYQKLSDEQLKEMLENLLTYFGGQS